MSEQQSLFGSEVVDSFKTAKERYGIWPITVWDCDMCDPKTKELKKLIGDIGQARAGDGKVFFAGAWRETGTSAFYTGKAFGAFNPAVASWLLNCYAPKQGICVDPFSGGGTRAILSAKHGLDYKGCEIRQEEVDAVIDRCKKCEVIDNVEIFRCDARNASEYIKTADFLLTCPPYWNLEMYDGGEQDLSMIPTYEDFCKELEKVVAETSKILRPGAISCWVVGLHRDKNGHLMCMNHDVAEMHKRNGFWQKEEIVLSIKNTGSLQRVGNFEKGNKFLIRTHEYALIFVKK